MPTIDDKIFEFVYNCAMADATKMKAYPHINVNTAPKKSELVKLYPTVMAEVKTFADDVLDGNFKNQSAYDEAFYTLAYKITTDIKYFTFGNAQKLINMTFKYLYIMVYRSVGKKNRFRFCHCPVDQRIQIAVWRECKKNGIKLGCQQDFCYSWSMDIPSSKSNYERFQKAVRELIKTHTYGDNGIEIDYFLF